MPIRSNILTREPLPSVKNAFAIVSSEESHRNILLFLAIINLNQLSQHLFLKVLVITSSMIIREKAILTIVKDLILLTEDLIPMLNVIRCVEIVCYPPAFKKPVGQSYNRFVSNNNVVSDNNPSMAFLSSEQM